MANVTEIEIDTNEYEFWHESEPVGAGSWTFEVYLNRGHGTEVIEMEFIGHLRDAENHVVTEVEKRFGTGVSVEVIRVLPL